LEFYYHLQKLKILMNKKVLICSGGTGGHVIPAIIFGNYLLNRGYDCTLILDKRGKSFSKEFKGKIYIINSSHLSGNIFFKIKSLVSLFIGFVSSLILIYKIKPEKCLSFGSYATFSPLLAILILKFFFKINIFIHEQNSVIGKVNLIFIKYVDFIFTNFNNVKNLEKKFLKKKYYVGLPSTKNLNLSKLEFKRNNKKKVLFIYGGSQGSIPLIEKSVLILKNLDKKYIKEIKVIIQAPKELFKSLDKSFKELNIDYKIQEFYINIDDILSVTNIAITRAGAGTINDLIKFNIPSIIIPLHHSIYNHQYYNAKYLSDRNAAILMDEINFNININTIILKKLIFDYDKQKIMKDALHKLVLPDANQLMLKKIYI